MHIAIPRNRGAAELQRPPPRKFAPSDRDKIDGGWTRTLPHPIMGPLDLEGEAPAAHGRSAILRLRSRRERRPHGDVRVGLDRNHARSAGHGSFRKGAAQSLRDAGRSAAWGNGLSSGRRRRPISAGRFPGASASRRSPARGARSCSIASPRMRPAYSASPGCCRAKNTQPKRSPKPMSSPTC